MLLRSLATVSDSLPHRSFFRLRLQVLSAGVPLDEWLVAQANARGYFGAYGRLARRPFRGLK